MHTNQTSPPYFRLPYGSYVSVFLGNEGGGLTEVSEANDSPRALSKWSIIACNESLDVIKTMLDNSCRAIGARFGWHPNQIEEEHIGIAFTQWIQSNPIKDMSDLDLSNLNIQILPPQFNPKLFPHLKNINLSNNQLMTMPNTLRSFSLLEFDLNGNPIPQHKSYDWLDNSNLQHLGNNIYKIRMTSQPRRA